MYPGSKTEEKILSFCHLHLHSHYSLLDGLCQIPDIVARVKELGMDSCAITDHGCLHGALKFYQECRKHGINPIIGYEAYVVADPRSDDRSNYHLTILARDRKGYQSLLRLASTAFIDGFYYKPRISKVDLCNAREGLTVLSGCMSSEFARSIDDRSEAMAAIEPLIKAFGDQFFIEIQRNGMPAQEEITKATIDFANHYGLPMVATADTHYVNKDDASAQDILLCVNTGSRRSQSDRMQMDGSEYFIKSPEEMYEQFKDQPDAVHRAAQIASSVEIEIGLGSRHFPKFEVQSAGPTVPELHLQELAHNGLKARLPDAGDDYVQRLQTELEIIHELGFDEYFLIIHDFVKWGRERGIMSSARGSGVGSLVCYCLYISHVDPLEHGLLFERFLSRSRREAPDIDVDFDKDRRAEVMQYVKDKYGEDCVAQIGTFGTMGPKSAIKDVARVLGYPLDDTNKLTSLIPDDPFHELPDTFDTSPEFREIYENNRKAKEVIDYALKLEGTARSLGTHAAAVVISDRPLVEYVPLAKVAGKGEVITQWDMHDCEAAGLVKLDMLGLRNMTILSEVVRTVEENHGVRIDLMKIPFDDPNAYSLLCRGETKGVFQLESAGMTELLMRLEPETVEHICACIALYRPGPLDSGMVDSYVEGKNTGKWNKVGHSVADDILAGTYGVIVYQETSMLLAHHLAGIPMDESYTLIKGISKKKPEIVNRYKDPFLDGCKASGVDGKRLWSTIEASARYQFNKSHSMAYAFVSYWTAWFKANYPVEFMTALLNADVPNRNFAKRDSLVDHLEDCRRMGIRVLAPNINSCGPRFKAVGSQIQFGLSAIKGVGAAQAEAIETARGDRMYIDILDFTSRVSKAYCPAATLRNLIRVGACDSWPHDRGTNELAIPKAQKLAVGAYKKPDRVNPYESKREFDLDPLELERELLGYYLSGHPADAIQEDLDLYTTVTPETFSRVTPGTMVIAGGLVAGMRRGYTKNENPYAAFQLETRDGSVDCVMWSPVCTTNRWLDNGALTFVEGRLDARGSQRSITVKTVHRTVSWTVAYHIGRIPCGKLIELCQEYPGDRKVYWLCDGQEVELTATVKPCAEFVDRLEAAGAEVGVCYE